MICLICRIIEFLKVYGAHFQKIPMEKYTTYPLIVLKKIEWSQNRIKAVQYQTMVLFYRPHAMSISFFEYHLKVRILHIWQLFYIEL